MWWTMLAGWSTGSTMDMGFMLILKVVLLMLEDYLGMWLVVLFNVLMLRWLMPWKGTLLWLLTAGT